MCRDGEPIANRVEVRIRVSTAHQVACSYMCYTGLRERLYLSWVQFPWSDGMRHVLPSHRPAVAATSL